MNEPTDNRVTTTELLDFLAKAHKVSPLVKVEKKDKVYKIEIYCDRYNDGRFCPQTTLISKAGTPVLNNCSDIDFFVLDNALDVLVKEREEREAKEQKRLELLSRLTPEERELLGVK